MPQGVRDVDEERKADEHRPDLSDKEFEEAEKRSAPRAHVVHEAIRLEGEEELKRSSSALAWSGLAAGLSMGFSLIGEGLLRSKLPDAPWRPLIAKFGYSFGFVLTILGKQQLFTENTLTPILPLLHSRDRETLWHVLRLWAVVLAANLAGALAIAWVVGNTGAFRPNVRLAFSDIARESLDVTVGLALLRGVFAGWLIAFMIWLMPLADTSKLAVIIGLTWLVGVAGLTHIVAGAVEVMYAATTGLAPWGQVINGYMLPTLIGNIVGGVSLVAVLNHAQVVSS